MLQQDLDVESMAITNVTLKEIIENFKSQHTDLKIIIIDTLQKIRSGDDASYASDYKEMSVLKNLLTS